MADPITVTLGLVAEYGLLGLGWVAAAYLFINGQKKTSEHKKELTEAVNTLEKSHRESAKTYADAADATIKSVQEEFHNKASELKEILDEIDSKIDTNTSNQTDVINHLNEQRIQDLKEVINDYNDVTKQISIMVEKLKAAVRGTSYGGE